MTLRRLGTIALLAVLLLGCSGDDDTESSSTSTTTDAVESTSTSVTADADVLDAYQGFWDAYLAAADPMDPAHPDLELYATGASLDRVREAFAEHFAKGEVIRGTVDLAPVIEELDDAIATVRDCYLDQTHVFDSATGEQVDPPGEATFEVVATLVLESGSWKVSTLDKVSDGCAR
jgi:hypothetical protein